MLNCHIKPFEIAEVNVLSVSGEDFNYERCIYVVGKTCNENINVILFSQELNPKTHVLNELHSLRIDGLKEYFPLYRY